MASFYKARLLEGGLKTYAVPAGAGDMLVTGSNPDHSRTACISTTQQQGRTKITLIYSDAK